MLGVSQELENVPIRWHLTREFAAWNLAFSNPNRSQTSLNGSSQDEKVSVNNALRHVIFGGIIS
jgi:hypothetical protein